MPVVEEHLFVPDGPVAQALPLERHGVFVANR